MKEIKYLLGVSTCIGPQTLECMIPSFSVAFVGRYLLKKLLACLHSMHSLHTSFGTETWGSPSTILCLLRRCRYLKLRGPSQCHNHSILFSEVARHLCFRIFIPILKVLFWDKSVLITSFWTLSNTLRQLSFILITNPFSSSWPRLNRLVFMPGTNNTSSMTVSFPFFFWMLLFQYLQQSMYYHLQSKLSSWMIYLDWWTNPSSLSYEWSNQNLSTMRSHLMIYY